MTETFFACNNCGAPVYVRSAHCYKCKTFLPASDKPKPRQWYESNALLFFSFAFCLPVCIVLLFARYDAKWGKIAAVVMSAVLLFVVAYNVTQALM